MDTESLMKFDYSVGTEERFAFRKWLQAWSDQFANLPKNMRNLALADEFVAIGFAEQDLSTNGFKSFWDNLANAKQKMVVRLPEARVRYDNFLYSVNGSLEIFIDGILCFSGDIDCRLKAADGCFEFVRIKFYPRMSMRLDI